ncbi:MAG: hypothetical protein GC162_13970 [Planctomycetes bacterium]|nr:hypothetical protein [Planctomycetota bacterium]
MLLVALFVALPYVQAEDKAPADAPKTEVKSAEPASAAGDKPAAPSPFNSLKEKVSYGIGLNIGTSIAHDHLDLDPKIIAEGIADAMAKAEPKLKPEEIQAAMVQFQQKLADDYKVEQKQYLTDNAKKDGVKVLPSGLQYKVIKEGDGPMPKPADTVKTHYRGTLTDGTVFDSSYDRGEPVTFPVQGVIPGWVEALQLMKVGSKWQLVIPAELAYGDNPRPGGPIRPGATLIFDIELLGIEK